MNIVIQNSYTRLKKLLIVSSLLTHLIPAQTISAMEAAIAPEFSTPHTDLRKTVTSQEIEALFAAYSDAQTEHEKEAAMQQILDTIDINAAVSDYYDYSLLSYAISEHKINLAEVLIKRGAHLHATQNKNQTPLILAAIGGDPALVKMLIAYGAEVNTTDKSNDTPLMWAIYHSWPAVVSILLDHNADIHVKNTQNCTPLYYAVHIAEYNRTQLIASLILAGAHYTDQDFNEYPDDARKIIAIAQEAKTQIDQQDWLPGEFATPSTPAVNESREIANIRHLIATYVNPYASVFSFFLEDNTILHDLIGNYAHDSVYYDELELHRCVVREVKRRHEKRAAAALQ